MEQKTVCTLIQELLVKNESVLLPGTGIFSVESSPAAFAQDGKTILPPSKKLLFKSDVVEGNYEPWQKELSGKIQEAFAQHREYELPGVGVFSRDGEGNTTFSIDEDFDFAPDNFSLEAISLETNEEHEQPQTVTVTETEPATSAVLENKKGEERPVTEKKSHKWVVWLAVIVGTLVLLAVLAMVFKENLKPLLENMLYSKEELEIIQKWAAQ